MYPAAFRNEIKKNLAIKFVESVTGREESILPVVCIKSAAGYLQNKWEKGCAGKYTLLRDEENPRLAIFERRLPCCGCGIGWSSFLLGFLCPLIWYFAATLYYCKYYNKDPRERPGLAASAVAALIFTVLAIIALSVALIICV